MSFRWILPEQSKTSGTAKSVAVAPVVVEIPHASVHIPKGLQSELQYSERDLRADSDAYVDELFTNVYQLGASVLIAEDSRYIVDLNRTEDDIDALSVPSVARDRCAHGSAVPCDHAPRGVIWRENSKGIRVLTAPLTLQQYQHRMDQYYLPYHRSLQQRLQLLQEQFGYVLLLCAHSMPSFGRGPDGGRVRRADVVPGTRGQSTAHPGLIALVDQHFRNAGLSVRHDDPYRGGATTIRWGRPVDGFHAVQIELSRSLYMDEFTAQRRVQGLKTLAAVCHSLIEQWVSFVPRAQQ